MPWSSPRTWVSGEVTTAAMHNTHIKENLLVLKTGRDDLGRIEALDSSTLADLSSANLTGLARPGQDNDFTGGTHHFRASRLTPEEYTARVVLPVGADKYVNLGGGLRAGIWVEGGFLHHIAKNQTTEYRYDGFLVQAGSPGLPGSAWVEDHALHYVDANGDERRVLSTQAGHNDSVAQPGSVWIETYLHYVDMYFQSSGPNGQLERVGHYDVAHQDETTHTDAHQDVAHDDQHFDTGHSDSGRSHVDAPHADHSDAPLSHEDASHLDQPATHNDVAHSDGHDDIPHTDHHFDHGDHGDQAAIAKPTVVP